MAMLVVWWYRKNQHPQLIQVTGETMATTYHVSYFDEENRNFKESIDSVLLLVNKAINNYDSTSEVSRFNISVKGIQSNSPYFIPPLKIAQAVFTASSGAFDMTVMPLVNAWGFGPSKAAILDSTTIDSLRSMVGFEKITFNNNYVGKKDAKTQLDFGGIGQGYGADVITAFLKSKGIKNLLVELGGEGVALGMNLKTNKAWQIGILDPNSTRNNQYFKAYAALSNKAFTTSGNYFNYKVINGRKYSHIISPQTGYPVNHALLSATIFASDCTTADAWGTALMVMGHEKAIEIVGQHPELEVLLLYTNAEGAVESFVTKGMKPFITIN